MTPSEFWKMHPTDLMWLIEAKVEAARPRAGLPSRRELDALWDDMKEMEGFPHG